MMLLFVLSSIQSEGHVVHNNTEDDQCRRKGHSLKGDGLDERVEDFRKGVGTQSRSFDCCRILVHAQLPVRAQSLQSRQSCIGTAPILNVALRALGHLRKYLRHCVV